jgi:hypothetical protein
MADEDFVPTHTLAWHDAYLNVAITPSRRFEAKEGDGSGKLLTPAFTSDEWSAQTEAQWAVDEQGIWYFFGERVSPQPDVEPLTDR